MPGGPTLSKLVSKPVPASETWGKLTALDLANGGRVLWQVKTPEPLVGGTLATAGGLVFTGEANGHFSAYDAANVGAPPMSYAVNGRQFVAVATGTAAGPGGPRPGGAIMAFALPGQVVADGPAEDGGGRAEGGFRSISLASIAPN